MPAAGALSSSSRQRKMAAAASSSRRGSGLTGDRRGSTGSLRSLTGSSQRNLMRNMPPPQGSGVRLSESMPTLHEERQKSLLDSLRSNQLLDDSVRTNPELYLTHDDMGNSDTSFRRELQLRKQPPIQEETGTPNTAPDELGSSENVQRGEMMVKTQRTNSAGSYRIRTSEVSDSNGIESPTRPHNHWWPSWMDSACNVRLIAGRVVNDERVEAIILLMIVVNSIMMGIATFPVVKDDPDLLNKFRLTDQIFLIIFTVESSMQLLYYGWTLFKDGFLVFDLLIVVMSWALAGTQVIRAFRIFRALRLIVRIDTLKHLVQALFSVVPKMAAIGALLLLIFYIFSVMFTQLFKDMHEEGLVGEPYFSTLYDSFFTQFQMMTLDNWADILYEIQETYPWAWLPFVVFIIITGFVVVNLVIAVICDAVSVMGGHDKAGLLGEGSDDGLPGVMEVFSYPSSLQQSPLTSPRSAAERRLEELQEQLDEMAQLQVQMRSTIEVLVKRMREKALRESAELTDTSSVELWADCSSRQGSDSDRAFGLAVPIRVSKRRTM